MAPADHYLTVTYTPDADRTTLAIIHAILLNLAEAGEPPLTWTGPSTTHWTSTDLDPAAVSTAVSAAHTLYTDPEAMRVFAHLSDKQ